MWGRLAALTCLAVVATAVLQAQEYAARALDEMVATERAFAKLGAAIGARDSFLRYFADEAVSLDGEPKPAKDAIRAWPPAKAGNRLLWEPRTGDIAASGDLGYLTGPVVQVAADGSPRHSCYMSVWKRQPDGTFKVVMDFGASVPAAATFEKGFVRAWHAPRFAGDRTAGSQASLEVSERTLAERAEKDGAARAYEAFVGDDTRVYRDKMMPLSGRSSVIAWLAGEPAMRAMKAEHVEVASSGDLGYAWGRYTRVSADNSGQHVNYVRVWGRDASGAWHILFDVARVVAARP